MVRNVYPTIRVVSKPCNPETGDEDFTRLGGDYTKEDINSYNDYNPSNFFSTVMIKLILFYGLVLTHHIFIILLLLSPFYLIATQPFYIWTPLCVWILHLMFSPVLVCPATVWENRLRRQLGKPEIKTFFLHYYIKPVRKFIG